MRSDIRHRSAVAASGALIGLLIAGGISAAVEAQPGPLFPQPFEIEHHLVHDDGDGGRFVSEPVVDTYGGSWIVSRRPDGSRLIVDLARRELTEIRPGQGSYWTLSFDRFAELQRRLRAAQGQPVAEEGEVEGGASDRAPRSTSRMTGRSAAGTPGEDFVVTELSAEDGIAPRSTSASSGVGEWSRVADRRGVRRFRVARSGEDAAAALEVWVDPSLRLAPAALAAIDSLEADVLAPAGEEGSAAARPGPYLAAARRHAAGALPVRTVRPAGIGPRGEPVGLIEDVTTRLERLERFPRELPEIPEGLSRVPHPLEAVVRFLEEEAERDEVMSGRRGSSSGH